MGRLVVILMVLTSIGSEVSFNRTSGVSSHTIKNMSPMFKRADSMNELKIRSLAVFIEIANISKIAKIA